MNKYLYQLIEDARLPIVSDYDGCMFEARWAGERINIPGLTDAKLVEMIQQGEGAISEPVWPMVRLFSLACTEKYVVSHMCCNAELITKVRQIEKYYPMIRPKNVLKADSPEDKIRFLEAIEKKHGGFIYIDDLLPALKMFENHFGDNCKFFHISSLFV